MNDTEDISRTTHLDDLDDAPRLISTAAGSSMQAKFGRMQIASSASGVQAEQKKQIESSTPTGGAQRIRYLANLGNASASRFHKTRSIDDINVAVEAWVELVKYLPENHDVRVKVLHNLSESFQSRFELTRLESDLTSAINVRKEVLASTALQSTSRPIHLAQLARALRTRFELSGSMDALNEAIESTREVVITLRPNDPDRKNALGNLCRVLQTRYGWTKSKDDLNGAVHAAKEALTMSSEDDPQRSNILCNLGCALQMQHQQTGEIEDLNEAIRLHEQTVQLSNHKDPKRVSYLSNLGVAMQVRFNSTGSIADIAAAVDKGREASNLCSTNHPDRVRVFSNLGAILKARFMGLGSMNDLNEAIEATSRAVAFTIKGEPGRVGCLINLGSALSFRFKRTGSMNDLNAAIDAIMEGLELAQENHPCRMEGLTNLGNILLRRFGETGFMSDLNEAVEASKKAVELAKDRPDRFDYLNNLAVLLQNRFTRTGSLDDLNTAVEFGKEALTLCPSDHAKRADLLVSLGRSLRGRFERIASLNELNDAVDLLKEAIHLTATDDPGRAPILTDLGALLQLRYKATGSQDDVNEAVYFSTQVLTATPHDHTERHIFLSNLGGALQFRFEKTRSIADLHAAMDATTKGLNETPKDHPRRTVYLNNLAFIFVKLFEHTESMSDFDMAVKAYEEAVAQRLSPPIDRIICATYGARFLALKQVRRAAKMLQTAVELLPSVSLRTLQRCDQQFSISRLNELAPDAAALSVLAGDPAYKSVQLLEQARGLMARVHLETRSDITLLRAAHPVLAEKFQALCDELSDQGDSYHGSMFDPQRMIDSQFARRYAASKEFDETIVKIRTQEGFERFLLGPSEDEFKQMASDGPIVYLLASRFGSYGFLITTDGIKRLPLPELSYERLKTYSMQLLEVLEDEDMPKSRRNIIMRRILEWLWDIIAEPILDGLGFTNIAQSDAWPHIWWIPIGRLNLFPIHAAGYHSREHGETVMDRVISSYTPTCAALQHARSQLRDRPKENRQKLLLTSMPTTPKKSSLPFAAQEINALETILPGSVDITILKHPKKSEVLEQIRKCSLAHFICHGKWHPDPSRSQFLFFDWETNPFSVADMTEAKPYHAEFAYLSACHASDNRSLPLIDEGLHMAGACQLAGFPIVVGTLWQISDLNSARVAEYLYGAMLTDGQNIDTQKAASGLHFAIRKLRDNAKSVKGQKTLHDAIIWAPYIHVGA